MPRLQFFDADLRLARVRRIISGSVVGLPYLGCRYSGRTLEGNKNIPKIVILDFVALWKIPYVKFFSIFQL